MCIYIYICICCSPKQLREKRGGSLRSWAIIHTACATWKRDWVTTSHHTILYNYRDIASCINISVGPLWATRLRRLKWQSTSFSLVYILAISWISVWARKLASQASQLSGRNSEGAGGIVRSPSRIYIYIYAHIYMYMSSSDVYIIKYVYGCVYFAWW